MMLDQAGIKFEAQSPEFDEDSVKRQAGLGGEELALRLAQGKALSIDGCDSDWVIGSDSTVSVAGRRYSKPRSRDDAADHLRAFSGQIMELASAVALANDAQIDWSYGETARLHIRPLSEDFIQSYLDEEWPEVGYCVGVFRLEGRGVTLFDAIDGNYFTILGMPLLPLLGALRDRGLTR